MGKRNRKKGQSLTQEGQGILSIRQPKRDELNRLIGELCILTSYHRDKNVTANFKDVQILLSKITKLENDYGISRGILNNAARSETFVDLIEWVNKNGGKTHAVSVAEYPDLEFGLRADIDAQEGSLVCSIPRKVMMTLEDAEKSELGTLINKDPLLKHMGNVSLSLFLLLEYAKGKDKSFWFPYIATLPRSYTTVLYFTKDNIESLKGSPLQEKAIAQQVHIARQYAYFSDVFRKSSDAASNILSPIFCYDLYRWAVSTVLTRQNDLPSVDGSRRVPALIPLWDMCNHTNGPITTGYNNETNCSECFALKPLQRGEQVLISYGSRTNAEYFIHNGFITESNPNDTYELKLGLARTDPLHQLRSDLLSKVGIPNMGVFHLRSTSEPIDDKLLAFIRVFSMEKDDLEHWIESGRWNDLKCMDCALDTRIEVKAWSFLATRLSLLLSVYAQPSEMPQENRTAQLVRKAIDEEKRLLQAALEYARLKAEH